MKVRIELEIEWSEHSDDSHNIAKNFIKAVEPDMEQFWNVMQAGAELKGEPVSVNLIESQQVI